MATLTLSASQRDLLSEATGLYQEALAGSPAMAYLASRGLEAVAAQYRLGYVASPAFGHEFAQGMLAIPYLTPAGPVGMKFRRLDDGLPKYRGVPGQPSRLFNFPALFRAVDEVAICEGEVDTSTLDGVVGIPAVGIAGAQNWQRHFAPIFDGYPKVWIFADNDQKEDGSNPGWELAKTVVKAVPHAVMVSLPPNTDVNQMCNERGREAVLSLIRK